MLETRRTPSIGEAERGIRAIRRSLDLTEADAALVREAGRRLGPEVEGWVDRFYVRLITDPVAMRLLPDDATILRLKRTLTAWCHELFTLSYDEAYERARAAIGHTHVRIGMPMYLMVTAMNGIRRDMMASVTRLWKTTPAEEERTRAAMNKALDMELALMLEAYRRRARREAREQDRLVYAHHLAREAVEGLREGVATALQLVEAMGEPEAAEDEEALSRARETLRGLLATPAGLSAREVLPEGGTRHVRVADLFERALEEVSLHPHTEVEQEVVPPDLALTAQPDAVALAVEEMLHVVVEHSVPRRVSLEARERPGAGIRIEVASDAPPPDPRLAAPPLAFCHLLARAHGGEVKRLAPPEGGSRLRLDLGARGSSLRASRRKGEAVAAGGGPVSGAGAGAGLGVLAELGHLVATIAHEIRNPVASVAGALDLLEEQDDPQERARIVAAARHRLHEMRRMLDDVLRLARPTEGPPEPLDLGALVASALLGMQSDPRTHEIAIDVRQEAGPLRVLGHPQALRQALTNLLVNAIEAQHAGGRILVSLARERDGGVLRVRDEGPGVPLAQRPRLFEPFYTTKPTGTGLGLAFVKRAVGAAGGTVTLEDVPRGASFRIALPLADD